MPQQVQGPPDVFRSRYVEYEDVISGWDSTSSQAMQVQLHSGGEWSTIARDLTLRTPRPQVDGTHGCCS